MNNIDKLINNKLLELSKSKFRSSFHLRKYMIKYIDEKGMDTIKRHTADFIEQKLICFIPAYTFGKSMDKKNYAHGARASPNNSIFACSDIFISPPFVLA